MRILFIPGSFAIAHVTRLLVLANSLDKKKYQVIFASDQTYSNFIKKTAPTLTYYPIRSMESNKFLKRVNNARRVYLRHEIDELVKAELKLYKQCSPDIVIGDFRPTLNISSKIANMPYVAIMNAYWSTYSTHDFEVPGKIFGVRLGNLLYKYLQPIVDGYHIRPFNQVRRTYKLKPLHDLRQTFFEATWSLFADIPDIAPTKNLPKNHMYIGPISWEPKCGYPKWWNILPKNKPLIYLTMGSTGDISCIPSIIKALERLPVTIVIATAERFHLQDKQKQIYSANFLPGSEITKLSQVVICNGGCTTSYQALSNGIPILGFPSNMDQIFSMRGIEQNGAGIFIRPTQATIKNITTAVEKILEEKCFKKSAEKIQEKFQQYNATACFNKFIRTYYL